MKPAQRNMIKNVDDSKKRKKKKQIRWKCAREKYDQSNAEAKCI